MTTVRGRTLFEVTVTNTGTTSVKAPEASFALTGGQDVVDARYATVQQDADLVTVGGKGWNRTVRPGGSVSVTLRHERSGGLRRLGPGHGPGGRPALHHRVSRS